MHVLQVQIVSNVLELCSYSYYYYYTSLVRMVHRVHPWIHLINLGLSDIISHLEYIRRIFQGHLHSCHIIIPHLWFA